MTSQVERRNDRGGAHALWFALPLAVMLIAGCNSNKGANESKSVVAEPTPAVAAAQPAPGGAQEGVPVGPTGQTTPSPEPTATPTPMPNGDPGLTGNPINPVAGAPIGNKAPGDPYKPRPTPTLVVKDGKVVQQWQAPAEALSLVSPVKNAPDAVQLGREWYNQRCVDCHGKEGKGNGWLSKGVFKLPTNLASQMVQANSDGELYWKITNGRSPMPASRIRFTDEQRWQIVAYLRTLK